MSYQLIEKLKSLKPYDPIYGEYKIRLDANESFLHLDAETIQKITDGIAKMDFNRYPDHNAAIACNVISNSFDNSQPSCSAPRAMTSREHPAAKPFALYFFFKDFNSMSLVLFDGRPLGSVCMN